MLSNKYFSSNLTCIVVDEVHKVTWVKTVTSEKPFCEIFGQLSIIRSNCREGVPIFALSVTVDVDLNSL